MISFIIPIRNEGIKKKLESREKNLPGLYRRNIIRIVLADLNINSGIFRKSLEFLVF